jgi:hypothetical protein
MVVTMIVSRGMRGKGRKEFGVITDDFYDISLTNITTTIKKKKEKEKKETNEYRTYKIRKGPACYVPYISCLHVVRTHVLGGEPKRITKKVQERNLLVTLIQEVY